VDQIDFNGAAVTTQHRVPAGRRNNPMRQLNANLDVVAARDPTDGEYMISVARIQ